MLYAWKVAISSSCTVGIFRRAEAPSPGHPGKSQGVLGNFDRTGRRFFGNIATFSL